MDIQSLVSAFFPYQKVMNEISQLPGELITSVGNLLGLPQRLCSQVSSRVGK